jgi:hypothetical protein
VVISRNAECLICNKEYFIRVSIGLDSYQKHYFDCLDCEQPIGVAVRSKAPNGHIETVENCKLGGFDRSKTIINLHPSFCFPVDKYHDAMFFPSIEGVHLLYPHMRQREGAFQQDVASQFDIPNADSMWGNVKAIYQLSHAKGKDKALAKLIKGYNLQRNKVKIDDSNCDTYIDVMREFYDALFYPRVNKLYEPIKRLIDKLYDEGKLDDFYEYYKENLREENGLRYLSVFSTYFRNRDILGQLIYRARINNSEVDDLMVGSKNFDAIKLFYGEAYESLTSNFTVLACLNNLESGRKYDEFMRLTLPQYIKDLEKSKKDGPIKGNPIFSKFSESLDSSLRNGSHHASVWRQGEVIMYRSGGTGAERSISYSRYLFMCNVLTVSIAALHMVELHLVSKYS